MYNYVRRLAVTRLAPFLFPGLVMRGRSVQIVRGSDWCVPWEVRNAPDDGCVLASFSTQGKALGYCAAVGAKVTEVIHAGQPRRTVT